VKLSLLGCWLAGVAFGATVLYDAPGRSYWSFGCVVVGLVLVAVGIRREAR
jgi:hypothetical protein